MAGLSLSDVNIIGEISDKSLETEFRSRVMTARMRYMCFLAVAAGVLFGVITFVDVSAAATGNIWIDTAGRLTVLLLAIVMAICVMFKLPYAVTSLAFSATVLAAAVNALIMIYAARELDLVALSLCATAFITVIFALPGRWVYSLAISTALSIGVMAQNVVTHGTSDFPTGIVSIAVILVASACLSYMYTRSIRRHFIWEYDQLRRSLTDALTGIGNRKRFEIDMKEALLLAQREVPFCVVMLDIDDFEQFVEKHGEPSGDAALMAFSQLIIQNIRGYECFSRYDASTFCLLTPHTAMDDAAGLAQRLCRVTTMKEMNLPERLSCGVGVAAHSPGDTHESIMDRVARCTAQAKRLGKNMVITEHELDDED